MPVLVVAGYGSSRISLLYKIIYDKNYLTVMPAFDAILFLALQHSCGTATMWTIARQRSRTRWHEARAALTRSASRPTIGCIGRPGGRLVPRVGFEPTAYRLRSGCSTTELSGLALAFGRVPIATEIGPVQVLSAAADGPEKRGCGGPRRGGFPSFSRPRQEGISQAGSTRNTPCRIAVKRSFAGSLFPTRVPARECWNAGAPPSLTVTIPTPGSPVFWMDAERAPFWRQESRICLTAI